MIDEIPPIPDKLFFRIGEVSQLVGVEPYVLRYWESEFPGLSPKKSNTGQRMFRRKDVEMVLEIKRLLYEKRYTIEGARKMLDSRPKRDASAAAAPKSVSVPQEQGELFAGGSTFHQDLRRELSELLDLLKEERSADGLVHRGAPKH